MQKYCVIDCETRSRADLKKVGAYEYAQHPSTQILCVGWKIGTRETLKTAKTEIWSPAFVSSLDSLRWTLRDKTTRLVAHNSFFEQMITRFVLSRELSERFKIDLSRWICTASLASSHALPRSLEKACEALSLPIQKDKEGRRLMLKLSKPRKATQNNPDFWHSKKEDLLRVMDYCKTDVDAETLLFLSLPELNPTERKVWELDQKINARGFHVDRDLIQTILDLMDSEVEALNAETRELTGGRLSSTTQRNEFLKVVGAEGCHLPDLRAKTVEEKLNKMPETASFFKRLLEIRQAVAKTSTAKYKSFQERSQTDGRVRDILVYHAASTGRWGGAGVQPQNFPRSQFPDLELVLDIVKTKDLPFIRACLGEPMRVFSSCLRPMITATPGHVLHGGDYASIETRVLFWIAGHEKGLGFYHRGEDLYKHMALSIYNRKDITTLTKEERQLGKTAILGCGYGMGPKKFLLTCHNQGQFHITEELAGQAVSAYREAHHPVVQAWYNLERVAIAATAKPGKKYSIHKTTWWVEGNYLYCELPSKRKLAYYGPQIHAKETPWGEKKATLHHWGVDSITKKWVFSHTYGGKLVENVVQAIARDIMAEAMLRLDQAGYQIVLSVHDEILAERETPGNISFEGDFKLLMTHPPNWAENCPIQVETWSGERYKK